MSAPASWALVPSELFVSIPGSPQPQQRARATSIGGRARMYEPGASRSWKGAAQVVMRAAAWRATGSDRLPFPPDAPLEVSILAVFPCPVSDYRKRDPRLRRWHTGSRGDVDNIAKAVLDAGNGALWIDDRQIASLDVRKVIGEQGEAPCVYLWVRPLGEVTPR